MVESQHAHINAQIIYWIITGGMSLLFLIVFFWVKRWINHIDKLEEEWFRQGGIVTREKFYAWCEAQQMKCSAITASGTLCDWRETMSNKGGPLTRNEHSEICKKITSEVADRFTNRLEELFEHHREWVGQELKIISAEQKSLNELVKEQIHEDRKTSKNPK